MIPIRAQTHVQMHLKTPCCKCTAVTNIKNVAPDAPHSDYGRMAPVVHRNFKTQAGAHRQKHESFDAHADFLAALRA